MVLKSSVLELLLVSAATEASTAEATAALVASVELLLVSAAVVASSEMSTTGGADGSAILKKWLILGC